MLIRVTNRCNMLCSHCMIEGVAADGQHMPMAIYKHALAFIKKCGSEVVLLSGGEPTMHPDILDIIDMATERFKLVLLATNGMFLYDEKLTKAIEKRHRAKPRFFVQITNDPKYYPKRLPKLPSDSSFKIMNTVHSIRTCKRVNKLGIPTTIKHPSCFNHRSATRMMGFPACVYYLETFQHKFCSPSININGSLRIGESDSCYNIGSIYSSSTEINKKILSMECNRCGLMYNLSAEHLRAIGIGNNKNHARGVSCDLCEYDGEVK